jgi:archaellum component FlaG (FlaF/FlaG flagellin family)
LILITKPDWVISSKQIAFFMKRFYTFLCVLGSVMLSGLAASAQDTWPKTVTAENGTVIKLYQLQPESFTDNTLQAKAAISIQESGKTDPVFGMAWLKAATTGSGNSVQITSFEITNIKLPGDASNSQLDDYANALEQKLGNAGISIARSDLQTSLESNTQEKQLSQQINNTPPRVIYSTNPSILVLIDGAPKLQRNSEWGLDAVVNTPFTIVKNSDGQFYLYGGKHWYAAPSATGPYAMTTNVSAKLNTIAQQVNDANKDDGSSAKETDENTMYKIIVSTDPAELIQSNGEANFSPVQSTELLYVSNSEDDIFMDTQSQQYYVLISGRWYKSKTLSGNWQYVGADKLPADFTRIPEGSPKDNVLSSVAGTTASQDAIQDAEVPQTAKVDRQQAKADVEYDGDPQFEDIDGTDMDYAVNTSSSVIRWRNRYYSVDNGIWFESYSATGPWAVCVNRPSVVSMIPPRYPVYNMKYVYIYDVSPDYVWMGYTPGYLNTYVYGPTIVYGTGYYYRPWFGHRYFPRPYTWGFGIRYNPWFGWGFGFNYNSGWFHSSIGYGSPWGYGYGGWWGPSVYRPSYCYAPYRTHGGYYGGGYYSRGYRSSVNVNIVNINRTNNIYNHRGGSRGNNNRAIVSTRDNSRAMANNRDRFLNRQGYANGRENNNNNNRSGSRFDNNNRAGGNNDNNNRFGNRRDNNNGGLRGNGNNNGAGNNNNFPRRDNNNGNNNGGVQRPAREWRPLDNNRGGNSNTRPTNPGTTAPRPMRERTTRDNNGGGNSGGVGTPETRQPRVFQPRSNDNGNRGGFENRRENPVRTQPSNPQPQPRPSMPQRSIEPRGGGESRGGGNSGGGGSNAPRPSRGGGERSGGGEHSGGSSGSHGRRG